MQRAYGYLTNPATRIIYDKYGVQGIKVYEQFKEDFREISEELRTQDLEEDKKKELESVRNWSILFQQKVLRKSQNLIRSHIRNQLQNQYKKHYMVELSFNMKSFCNNYHHFYYAGKLGQSLKLIRTKSMVTSVNLSFPIPHTKLHVLDFQVMAQNDIKKGLGISMLKIGHNYERSPTLALRVSPVYSIICRVVYISKKEIMF